MENKVITLNDIIKELQDELTALEKKIECDAYNGISSPSNDSKRDLLKRVIKRLTEYKESKGD